MGARLAAAVFGLVLVAAGAFSAFLALLPLIRSIADGDELDLPLFAVALLGSMASVLVQAGWSLIAAAVTERPRPVIHRGSLWVFGVVLVVQLAGAGVVGLIKGEWSLVLYACMGIGILWPIGGYLRKRIG